MIASPHADLTERASGAGALAAYALDIFTRAADDLDKAAGDQEMTAQLAEERISELRSIVNHNYQQAEDNRRAATAIRKVIGQNQEESK